MDKVQSQKDKRTKEVRDIQLKKEDIRAIRDTEGMKHILKWLEECVDANLTTAMNITEHSAKAQCVDRAKAFRLTYEYIEEMSRKEE